MTSSGSWCGRSELSGSRAKSKPDIFPSFGCVFRTGEDGRALVSLNWSDWSCDDFCCSGRVERGSEDGCCASPMASRWGGAGGFCAHATAKSQIAAKRIPNVAFPRLRSTRTKALLQVSKGECGLIFLRCGNPSDAFKTE